MIDTRNGNTHTEVLVIAPSVEKVQLLIADVEALECHVSWVRDMNEALTKCSETTLALVLVDIQLIATPPEQRRHFLETVRQIGAPLIFLGADPRKISQIENAYAMGADDVLTAPYSKFILQTKINYCLMQFDRKRENALRTASERSMAETEKSQLLENALDAVVGVASDEKIIYWNRQAEIIFGWSKDEAVHQAMVELIVPEKYRAAHRNGMTHFLTTGETSIQNKRIEVPALKKSGEEFIVELTVTSMKAADGTHRFYSFIRDITDRVILRQASADLKKAMREAEVARDEAQRANQLKSDFLANMSHEIRTPLGAMLGFADLLRDQDLSHDEQLNYIDVLSRNGESLSVIINDILDLSKVEAGHLSLEFTDTYPAQIGRDVMTLLQVKAKQKQLHLEFTLDAESCPLSLVSDPTRVRQVLMNLVGNAIKFTDSGSVRIHGTGGINASGNKFLSYDITDSGIGISPAQTEKIFEMFVQADGSMTRRFGGTGLGLSLSRKLARALGGDVSVASSRAGRGTTFRAVFQDLPQKRNSLAEPSRLGPFALSQRHLEAPLKGVRVLVVDDAPDNQHLIRRYLTKQGAEVECADNGLLGFRAAMSGNFDLVLMDIQMPVMDGFTATQTLRENGYKKPIIALTAHAMTEVRKKALFVGYTDHLPKPINPRELIDSILLHTSVAH